MNLGLIGCGNRGMTLLPEILKHDDIIVTWVCDLYADRTENAATLVKDKTVFFAKQTLNYNDVISAENTDCIIIASSWNSHLPILKAAMSVGKPTEFEVGGAYTLQECFDLVALYEKTKTPVMMLENCCYGKLELMARICPKKGFWEKSFTVRAVIVMT